MSGVFPISEPNDRQEQHRAQRRISEPMQSHREGDDAYRKGVVRFNEHWRVIECRDGIQWILQFARKNARRIEWRGRGYCRTKAALIRASAASAGEIDGNAMAILEALPEWIGGRP